MDYQVSLTEVEPRPTAVIAATTTWPEFPALWGRLLGEVWDCLHAGGIYQGCRNIMLYRDGVPNVEVGVLLGQPCPLTGRVVASALPAGEPIDVTLRRELSRDERWPDDEQMREGIATVPYYSHGRAHQQRLVLQRLESHLRAEIDVDFDSANLSIEHIMPQTLSTEWKAELSENGHNPQETFDRLGHTLGNLTLTVWNSKLSNQLFERKREILSDSELKLNEALATATSWGAEEIEARASELADVASALWSAPVPGVVTPRAGFDWGLVDQAISSLPAGSWTSYGDLAELVGTAAQPTANHVAKDPSIEYAHRVLSGDGSVSDNFGWHDERDTRDPAEVLIGEGVDFDEHGRASQTQRLGPAELEALLEAKPAAT